MKVYLNVRINLMDGKRMFTVWPRANRFLPGIEFHSGISESIVGAINELLESLPHCFTIDDETSVSSTSLDFVLIRPFDIVDSNTLRVFIVV